jgi:hypothetical protein
VTSALIHGRQLGIAHTPALSLYPGFWGYIQRRLSDQVQLLRPASRTQQQAWNVVNDWARSADGIRHLRKSIAPSYYASTDTLTLDSFVKYQENMVVHTWPALVGPHQIFEKGNIKSISKVIEVSQKDLRLVYEASKDIQNLRRFAAEMPYDDELFTVLWRAYLVDLLIRGRYHYEAARLEHGQVLHHPARRPVLRRLAGRNVRYRVTNTDRAFSNILIIGALAETTPQKRMDLWLENVLKARRAASDGALNLVAKDTDESAERLAAKHAMTLNIRTHPRLFDDITDATIAAGTGVLTSFVLTGWADIVATVGMYAASKSEELGSRVGRLTFEREGRLQKFASSKAGRVERLWL